MESGWTVMPSPWAAGGEVVGALAVWLGWKLWQRQRFRKESKIAHIAPDELLAAMQSAHAPLLDGLLEVVGAWPKNQPIVTLCACPEDATAIQAARKLLSAGYLSVRPLKGGYEAWLARTSAA